jgi:hypothetical protein
MTRFTYTRIYYFKTKCVLRLLRLYIKGAWWVDKLYRCHTTPTPIPYYQICPKNVISLPIAPTSRLNISTEHVLIVYINISYFQYNSLAYTYSQKSFCIVDFFLVCNTIMWPKGTTCLKDNSRGVYNLIKSMLFHWCVSFGFCAIGFVCRYPTFIVVNLRYR